MTNLKQNVDFYKFVPKTRMWLSQPSFFVIILIGVILTVWLGFKVHPYYQDRAFLTAKAERVSSEVAQLKEEKNSIPPKKEVVEVNTAPIGPAVIGEMPDSIHLLKEGFYPVFRKLASQTYRGVWLNHIVVNNSTKQITLEGQGISEAAIRGFLTNLTKINFFKGRNMTRFTVNRVQGDKESKAADDYYGYEDETQESDVSDNKTAALYNFVIKTSDANVNGEGESNSSIVSNYY